MILTYVLTAEALVFAALAFTLWTHTYNPRAVRTVAGILGALVVVVVVMVTNQRRLLRPFATRVGLCQLCGAK